MFPFTRVPVVLEFRFFEPQPYDSIAESGVGRNLHFLGPPARCPFTVSFLVGRVPLLKETTEKNRVPTYSKLSNLEDLGEFQICRRTSSWALHCPRLRPLKEWPWLTQFGGRLFQW